MVPTFEDETDQETDLPSGPSGILDSAFHCIVTLPLLWWCHSMLVQFLGLSPLTIALCELRFISGLTLVTVNLKRDRFGRPILSHI